MLARLLRGPKFGQEVHLPKSQETNLAILLGDIELVEPTIPNQNSALPPAGWSVMRDPISGKLAIRHDDGFGASRLFSGPPIERRWVFRPGDADADGHYENVCDCPPEVIAQFEALRSTEPAGATFGPFGSLGNHGESGMER